MKKGKLFAPFLTLFSVAVCLFVMLRGDYSFKDILVRLLIVLIVFYIIGSLIQNRVIKFVEANEEKLREEEEKEGAVIEKEAPDTEDMSQTGEGSLPPLTGAMPKRPGEDESDDFRVAE